MCRNCETEMREEIQQLVNREGAAYQEMVDTINKNFPEISVEERVGLLEAGCMVSIAQRAAFIISYTPNHPMHQTAPSIILGTVAGMCLEIEAALDEQNSMHQILSRLGLGEN